MRHTYFRIYQIFMRIASYFTPWRKPLVLEGKDSTTELSHYLIDSKLLRVLIVTDNVLVSLGLLDKLMQSLDLNKIHYTIYDKTVPNPTILNVEEAFIQYHDNACEAIIAFGGGSSIDCGKAVAARVARPKKTINQLKGYLKVLKATPPIIAIPTTSGTGSEATIASVIVNSKTNEKFAINDMVLIPNVAVLDPTLTLNLPRHMTSTTGMDALTHAVEAYIGKANTKETKSMSINAIKLIFNNLQIAYNYGHNIEARTNMQRASYYAGIAFTRAYIGYVHAIAHQLGGLYSVPHGLANAVTLPYVLEYYGSSIHKQLSELADITNTSSPNQTLSEKATSFIETIKTMNSSMNITDYIIEIKEEDIDLMVNRAYKEANPAYPVPKILTKKDLKTLFKNLMIQERN